MEFGSQFTDCFDPKEGAGSEFIRIRKRVGKFPATNYRKFLRVKLVLSYSSSMRQLIPAKVSEKSGVSI
jgi:hypothetical protein